MNLSLWNTTEKAVLNSFLGGSTLFVYFYAIFLCYAIYDYQNEKPKEEKCLIDHQIKDWMNSRFYFLYYSGLVQFISIFTPPITNDLAYWITYVGILNLNFEVVSTFVYFYIEFVYVFHYDTIKVVHVSTLRRKSLAWKFILTFISIFLNIGFPMQEKPATFQWLTKGKYYDRYFFRLHLFHKITPRLSRCSF